MRTISTGVAVLDHRAIRVAAGTPRIFYSEEYNMAKKPKVTVKARSVTPAAVAVAEPLAPMQTIQPAGRAWLWLLAGMLALIAATVAIYWQTRTHDFVNLDDLPYIHD